MASISSTLQTDLLPRRRYLALFLPDWATDFLKRHDAQLRESKRPLALWEKQHGGMRLVALDDAARRHGLSIGLTVSDARAQVPEIEVREIDQAKLEMSFADFADWHSNASPMVAVLTDEAPYGDLILDITGVSHLFGGEEQMLATLTSRLHALGYAVRGAVATTIGAAWAMVHAGRTGVFSSDLRGLLAPLPVAALRLEEQQVAGLNQAGLKTIGRLYERSRRDLQARFGSSLLTRLDQALASIEEKMTPRLPLAERFVERRFSDPIGLMDDVLMCSHDLAVSLSYRLEQDGVGAKSFHLFLYRVDHKVMSFTVTAGRVTRDAGHIARLFANRSKGLEGEYDAGFGIDMIRLAASSIAELDPAQIGVFSAEDETLSLDRLYDRISNRLGAASVLRSQFANTHIPEQAVRLVPAAKAEQPAAFEIASTARPLRLLPQPEPITVIAEVPDSPPVAMAWRRVNYRFVKASGPERISAEWWTGTQRPVMTAATEQGEGAFDERQSVRDYYVAEDDGGRRFWLFRQGQYDRHAQPKWFMHGFFA